VNSVTLARPGGRDSGDPTSDLGSGSGSGDLVNSGAPVPVAAVISQAACHHQSALARVRARARGREHAPVGFL